jgi:U3 small nucleolar RNA-associated protein 16
MQKEKRRLLDERHKSQVKASTRQKQDTFHSRLPDRRNADDDVSESSATLQGSTRESQKVLLPALLPDEILNAVSSDRISSPPPGVDDFRHRKPQKLRFLESVDKSPKDIHHDDVTIRVIGDSLAQKKGGVALPPKISKGGRNVKQAWLAGRQRSKTPAGLKRMRGGTSAFVRSR